MTQTPTPTPGESEAAGAASAPLSTSTLTRYQANLQSEQEGAALYQLLAAGERDERLAEIYRRMAAVEQRHAELWAGRLRQAGAAVPAYTPGWRIRTLGWLARRLGAAAVLPIVTSMERDAVHTYDGQPEAQANGLPADERSHARVLQPWSKRHAAAYRDRCWRGSRGGTGPPEAMPCAPPCWGPAMA